MATLCFPRELLRIDMDITPKLKVDRFAQLASGDLFIFTHENGSCVALKVEDPANDGDKLILPLGPTFPAKIICPTLVGPQSMTVISFERDYILQLPPQASGWLTNEPSPDKHCLVVTDNGIYIRANWSRPDEPFRACYVDIKSGSIRANASQYAKPVGTPAYAIEWALLTNEKDPRAILSYPFDRTRTASLL
jgi:hypothetical protein